MVSTNREFSTPFPQWVRGLRATLHRAPRQVICRVEFDFTERESAKPEKLLPLEVRWVRPYLLIGDVDGALRAAARGSIESVERKEGIRLSPPPAPVPGRNPWEAIPNVGETVRAGLLAAG